MAGNNEFYRLDLVLNMKDNLSDKLSKQDKQVEKFDARAQRLQHTIDKLGGTNASPKVSADTSKAEAQIEHTERMLHKVDRIVVNPKISLDDRTAGKANAVESRLHRLTSKTWKIAVDLKDGATSKIDRAKGVLSSPIGMLGMGAATFGIGDFIVDSTNKAMDFTHQISSIRALTNMEGEELEKVRQKALDLGKATQFSPTEAAQGMTELLKAGMSVEQVMQGAADAALDLAAAGELSLPEAAEVMSTAMNAFNVSDAAHAADILAGAANASATDVHELKYSLSMCSAVAAIAGMSFDDTNTALGVFAMKGLKGNEAGTSLKTMLMNLQPATKQQAEAMESLGLLTEQGTSAFYDAEGRLKSLADIAELLHDRMKNLNPMEQTAALEKIFGSDAVRAGGFLMQAGAEGVNKMHDAMTEFTASGVAKQKWEDAKGDIMRLNSAFQVFQIKALGPLEPAISRISKGFTDYFAESADGAANTVGDLAQNITDFMDELAGDDVFQQMDWGDKIVYVLDRMMEAIDKWASGPGGEQFGKVMTKLAEIGMRAFLAALLGLMKGSLNALMHGNLAGAAGLAMGASFLGAGTLLGGAFKGVKGLGGMAFGGSRVGEFYGKALDIAKMNGESGLKANMSAAKFTFDLYSPVGKAFAGAAGFVEKFGKRVAVVGAAIDGYRFYQSDDKLKTGSEIAGGWAGALAGAKAGAAGGAAIGALFGGVGAAPGAFIGGLAGAVGGYGLGSSLGGGAVDFSRESSMPGIMADGKYMNMESTMEPTVDWSQLGAGLGEAMDGLKEKVSGGLAYMGETVNNAKTNINNILDKLFSEESFSQASASINNIVSEVETGAQGIYASLTSWIGNAIAYATAQFDSLVGRVSSAMAATKQAIWDATPGPVQRAINFGVSLWPQHGHAEGGIFNQEHIARFAEGGKAEAVVPLDNSMRTQGLSIWQQAGQMLGVNADLFSGMMGTGYQPAMAAAGGGSGSDGGGGSNSFSFNGMNINIGNNKSEDEMALSIGRRILAEIHQSFENRE